LCIAVHIVGAARQAHDRSMLSGAQRSIASDTVCVVSWCVTIGAGVAW
jgi:hypothetical protein